jgi:hypothetical protein
MVPCAIEIVADDLSGIVDACGEGLERAGHIKRRDCAGRYQGNRGFLCHRYSSR